MLRAIAGLVRPERGRDRARRRGLVRHERGIDLPPERRSVGLVFQDYALFPHLTVARERRFGGRDGRRAARALRDRRTSRDERPARALGRRAPAGRARARARARACRAAPRRAARGARHHTRARVRGSSGRCCGRSACRRSLVTHDFQDAAALADRVGVLVEGELVQVGTPGELDRRAGERRSSPSSRARTSCAAGAPADGATASPRSSLEDGTASALDGRGARARRRRRLPVGDRARAEAPEPTRRRTTCAARSRASSRRQPRARPGRAADRRDHRGSAERRSGFAQGDPLVASFKAAGMRLLPL